MSASPYVLIAASTAVVGTLLVTELIRRKVSLAEEESEALEAGYAAEPAPPIEEIEAEDFSQYEVLNQALTPPPLGGVAGEEAQSERVSRERGRKRRRIGKRLERKIIKMWREGVPIKKIAEELGVSYSAVYRRIKKYRESKRV